MKFLIFEEYMIERVTFLQSILFFLAFSKTESKEADKFTSNCFTNSRNAQEDPIICIKSYKSTHLYVFQWRLIFE